MAFMNLAQTRGIKTRVNRIVSAIYGGEGWSFQSSQ